MTTFQTILFLVGLHFLSGVILACYFFPQMNWKERRQGIPWVVAFGFVGWLLVVGFSIQDAVRAGRGRSRKSRG